MTTIDIISPDTGELTYSGTHEGTIEDVGEMIANCISDATAGIYLVSVDGSRVYLSAKILRESIVIIEETAVEEEDDTIG